MSHTENYLRRELPSWSNDSFERGMVDLYTGRMAAVAARYAADRQLALDRQVNTQPFGRPFTAQSGHNIDDAEQPEQLPGGLVGLRRRVAGLANPAARRKLAPS